MNSKGLSHFLSERGQIVILTAIMLPVLLGFVGFAVDIGLMYHTRTDLQKASDAMVLSGATALCGTATCETTANSIANSYGTKNGVSASDTVDIQFGKDCKGDTTAKHDYVTVTLTRYQRSFFAKVLGFNGTNVKACSTARKYEVSGLPGNAGLRPWALEDTCIQDVTYGSLVVLKYGSGSSGSGPCDSGTGNFGAIDLDGPGANTYRNTIKYGSNSPVCADAIPSCPSSEYTIPTETGNMVGPTGDGVQYLVDNTPASCSTWAEVSDGNGGINPACNPWVDSYTASASRIVLIPVVHGLWSSGGKHNVTIKSFAIVFLLGYQGCANNGKGSCQVQAYFMKGTLSIPGSTRGDLSQGSIVTGLALIN